jgi:uncharacterized membrane protein YgaE (UPF0421/DUF939 family)
MQKISRREQIHRILFPNNIKPDWNAALYMFAALIVLFIISRLLNLGNLSIAFIISGAVISQVVVLNIPVRVIISLNIVISILIGIAFFTAAFGLIAIGIALIFLLIWGFLSSSLNILGKLPGKLGFIALVTYLVSILVIVNTKSTAIEWGLWAFLGALIASFILIIPKLVQKDKSTRQIVASCFIPTADTNTLIQAKALLVKSHPTPKIVSMMELSRSLLAARQLNSTIEPNLKDEAKGILEEFYKNVNQLSEEVANDILTDNNNPNLNITVLNEKINEMVSVTGLTDDIRLIIVNNMKKFLEIFEQSKKVLEGDLVLDIPPIIVSEEISPMKKLRANFNLHNMYIRHGIRLSIALGAAFIFTLVTSIHDVYWIAFSILAVLQPDISSTFNRMVIRVVATMVGVLLAVIISGILFSLGLQVILYAFILVLLAVLVAYMRASYLYYVVAVAMVVIFLQPSADIIATGLARFTDVIIGSLIAFIVGYVILPSKLQVNLPQQVLKRLKSNIDYINFANKPSIENKKQTSLALQEMILSHNNLEAGINKVINSFDDAGDDIKVLNSIAEASDRLSRDLSTSAKRVTTTTETHPIWESTTTKMVQVLTDLENSIANGTDPQPLPDSGLISARIEEKIESSDMDTKIVFEYLKWIISDIQSLYDSIRHAQNNEIFKKYKNV